MTAMTVSAQLSVFFDALHAVQHQTVWCCSSSCWSTSPSQRPLPSANCCGGAASAYAAAGCNQQFMGHHRNPGCVPRTQQVSFVFLWIFICIPFLILLLKCLSAFQNSQFPACNKAHISTFINQNPESQLVYDAVAACLVHKVHHQQRDAICHPSHLPSWWLCWSGLGQVKLKSVAAQVCQCCATVKCSRSFSI